MAVNKVAPQYPIKQVHLFGSYANGSATSDSDVDVLVRFEGRPITLLDLCGFQQDLSDLLDVSVDVLKSPLSPSAKEDMSIDNLVHLYG